MHLGQAWIMIKGPRDGTESPLTLGLNTQMLAVFVAEVDAHYARSRQQDALLWEKPHETVYGERQYGVKDFDGHRRLFSQLARDIAAKDWGATVANESH
jgi:uncharacterized glyoxalase superfamily protein PhnB